MNQEVETPVAVVYPDKLKTSEPLSLEDVKLNRGLVNKLMSEVLVKDMDFGTTPGCGDKPGLFKPGAEKIMLMFKLGCFPEPQDLSTEDSIKYVVKTRIVHLPTGIELGYGLGSCSTDEEKYKWRKAVCDEEFDATPDERKRLKWKAGWDGKPATSTKQVRTNPADLNNTVLKMACKRSKVDGVITCTAASDIFGQDQDDLDEEGGEQKPKPQKPQLNTATIPEGEFKEMKSKFRGKCKACEKPIEVGDSICYSAKLGTFHPGCLKPGLKASEKAPEINKAVLKNLEDSAKALGIDLANRIGQDGYETLEAITPQYAKDLLQEFGRMMDEQKE